MPSLETTPVNLRTIFREAGLAKVGRQVPGLFGSLIRWRDQDLLSSQDALQQRHLSFWVLRVLRAFALTMTSVWGQENEQHEG